MILGRLLFAALCLGIAFAGDCQTGEDGIRDCIGRDAGNYQHCESCKKYVVCDGSGGMKVKDTPPDKVFDANLGIVWWSYTCSWDGAGTGSNSGMSTDWNDITCINFDQSPDPFQGSKGIYVKHTGVQLADNNECGDPVEAGQCGYFPEGRAFLKIPYFGGNDFVKMTLSFWFKRSSSKPDGFQSLVNKYPEGLCSESALDVGTKDMATLFVEVVDINSNKITSDFLTADQSDWVHVVITYDGSWDSTDTMTVKTYIDGVLVDSNLQLKGRLKVASGPITVGVHACHDGSYFTGYMDTISFSRKILSASQVNELTADRSKCFA